MNDLKYPKDLKVGTYSDLYVMKSAAGYYVGTYYREEFGLVPGSRDSGYFSSYEDAESYLNSLTVQDNEPSNSNYAKDAVYLHKQNYIL